MPIKSSGHNHSDSVLLSPRIIDEAAFEDFAGRLREEIEQAGTKGLELRALMDQLLTLQGDLKQNTESHRHRLDLGAKLLRTLEARSTELEQSLNKLQSHTEALSRFEGEADQLLESRLRMFEQRLEQSFSRATERLHARAEERISLLQAKLDRIQQGETELSPSRVSDSLHAPASELTVLLQRLEESRDASQQAIRDLGQSLQGAMHLITELRTQRVELESDFETMIQRAERSLACLEGATESRPVPTQMDLAPELAKMTEAFRAELLQDLAKMAAAMNMIANRAETMLRPAETPDGSPEIVIRMRDQNEHSPLP